MALYCTCGGADKTYVAIPVDNLLWVHSKCQKPSRMFYERVVGMKDRLPLGAKSIVSVYGRADGMNEVKFATHAGEHKTILFAKPYDRRPHKMGVNPTDILLKTWQRLDLNTEIIMSAGPGSDPDAVLAAKWKARTLAEVLADMMPPFFSTPDEIVAEAIKRYQNRDDEYETPGLGVESLAAFEPDPLPKTTARATRTKAVEVVASIDDQLRAKIAKALASGMFTAPQLAKAYGLNEATVESCRGS